MQVQTRAYVQYTNTGYLPPTTKKIFKTIATWNYNFYVSENEFS